MFSQWGEDGIIQYLISKIQIKNKIFIEFGVQNYRESNTRFLLINNNWKGLIMDSGVDHINFLNRRDIKWRCNIDAIRIFITKDNINKIIKDVGISGDIGLLSIDLDGIDYWILKAINIVSPRILIVEYNSTFGHKHSITVPYRKDFDRTKAHYSNLYWGASLPAIHLCAKNKGYSFVGSNSAGCNAFFVRNDVIGELKILSPNEG